MHFPFTDFLNTSTKIIYFSPYKNLNKGEKKEVSIISLQAINSAINYIVYNNEKNKNISCKV
jgi:hypothetical protein